MFSHTFRIDFENYFGELFDPARMAEQTPMWSYVSTFDVKLLLRRALMIISHVSIGFSVL